MVARPSHRATRVGASGPSKGEAFCGGHAPRPHLCSCKVQKPIMISLSGTKARFAGPDAPTNYNGGVVSGFRLCPIVVIIRGRERPTITGVHRVSSDGA